MKKRFILFALLVLIFVFNSNAQIDIRVKQTDLAQCDTAGWVTMRMKIINFSPIIFPAGSLIAITYQVNNDATVVENLTTMNPMNVGDSIILQFSTTYHFNQFATYNCMFAAHYASDVNTTNDTIHYTRTFWSLPGFGNHSSDTSVCYGSPATLMMELMGHGPWLLTFAMGTDTVWDLAVYVPVLSTEMTLDSTTIFSLIRLIDSNGCMMYVNQSIAINIGYPFTLDIGHDTTMCAGQTLWLDAGHTGASYAWWDNNDGQVYAADTSDWSGVLGNQIVWVDVNDKGCIDRDSLTINWIVCPDGIAENGNETFDVFPNPTSGPVNIAFNTTLNKGLLMVENTLGQAIYRKEINDLMSSATIDLGSQVNGIYFITVISDNLVVRKKLLLER
jgi:hypothetical protein